MRNNPARPRDPIGWPLLPAPDETGSLQWPDLATSIRQTIRAILVTKPGERLLSRRLGGGLQDFIHQPNTVLTRKRVHDRIAEALTIWEPRIALTRLAVEPEGDFGEKLRITLDYRIRMTGAADGLSVSIAVQGG